MASSSASMAINAYIFFCYILYFSLNASKPFVNGATVMKKHNPSSKCSSGNAQGGLVISHRHGSCSPPSQTKSSATASQILHQDELRVNFVNSWTNGKAMDQGPVDSIVSQPVGAGIYTVSVGFGTPVKTFNLILDTGSYITWVRCNPKQHKNSKLYNPSSSSTFSRIPCPPKSKCDYTQRYFDKSSAKGFFVLDRVTIESDMQSNLVFLCAKKVSNIDEDGILGLGQGSTERHGNYSLISQTAAIFGQVFCHCLPTRENSGYLYFGKEALDKCQNSGTYTPLRYTPYPYYTVSFTAITIGTKRLAISSTISSSTRTIIDSGTVISRLPSSVYSALRSEFIYLMSGYPSARPNETLDTCYNLQGYDDDLPRIPNMVLHFENLDVNLDKSALTWKGNGNLSQVCLAFAKKKKETDLTIIGSHQLQKLNVLYNIQDRKIEIGPGNCQ